MRNASDRFDRILLPFNFNVPNLVKCIFDHHISFFIVLFICREQFPPEPIKNCFSIPLYLEQIKTLYWRWYDWKLNLHANIRPLSVNAIPHLTNAEPGLLGIFGE